MTFVAVVADVALVLTSKRAVQWAVWLAAKESELVNACGTMGGAVGTGVGGGGTGVGGEGVGGTGVGRGTVAVFSGVGVSSRVAVWTGVTVGVWLAVAVGMWVSVSAGVTVAD